MTTQGNELTEAEAIAIVVATALQDREDQRDQARRWALALEQELAAAEHHLRIVMADLPPSSWAGVTANREDAQAFLDRERVPEPGTVEPAPETLET